MRHRPSPKRLPSLPFSRSKVPHNQTAQSQQRNHPSPHRRLACRALGGRLRRAGPRGLRARHDGEAGDGLGGTGGLGVDEDVAGDAGGRARGQGGVGEAGGEGDGGDGGGEGGGGDDGGGEGGGGGVGEVGHCEWFVFELCLSLGLFSSWLEEVAEFDRVVVEGFVRFEIGDSVVIQR